MKNLLDTVAAVARPESKRGKVADYILSLAEADPEAFGMALVSLDGEESATGDADVRFPIQSLSKLFSLVLVMKKLGTERGVSEEVWKRVGREPSGDPFNSLVQLEHERGIPRNPMINAGALVIADLLLEHCTDPVASLIDLLTELTGERVTLDERVAAEEEATSQRNRAMGNLMAAFGNLNHPLDDVLDVYNRQCAITLSARQLARAGRFLADDGVDPASGKEILPAPLTRRAMAVMLTCGTYDAAGDFAFSVGLPCKSGVSGGILAIAPDHSAICVWSPPLDAAGNSVAGRVALHELTERLGLSIF